MLLRDQFITKFMTFVYFVSECMLPGNNCLLEIFAAGCATGSSAQ